MKSINDILCELMAVNLDGMTDILLKSRKAVELKYVLDGEMRGWPRMREGGRLMGFRDNKLDKLIRKHIDAVQSATDALVAQLPVLSEYNGARLAVTKAGAERLKARITFSQGSGFLFCRDALSEDRGENFVLRPTQAIVMTSPLASDLDEEWLGRFSSLTDLLNHLCSRNEVLNNMDAKQMKVVIAALKRFDGAEAIMVRRPFENIPMFNAGCVSATDDLKVIARGGRIISPENDRSAVLTH